MSLSNKSYEELEKASQEWADWHKKVIVLDEGRKATYSKLFLKYKKYLIIKKNTFLQIKKQ